MSGQVGMQSAEQDSLDPYGLFVPSASQGQAEPGQAQVESLPFELKKKLKLDSIMERASFNDKLIAPIKSFTSKNKTSTFYGTVKQGSTELRKPADK